MRGFLFLPLLLSGLSVLNAQTSQTITFQAIPNQILGGSPFVVAARASSGLPVTVTSITPSVCRAASVVITLWRTGTCSIQANQGGNTNYAPATALTRSFTVSEANTSTALTLAPGNPFPAGTGPSSVAVADFNGDGHLDIAAANDNDSTVTIFLADGLGGFGLPPGNPFATGANPTAIVTGDFNGDGIPDLATANFGGSSVTVLLGNGSGGFTPAPGSPFSVGSHGSPQPVSIAVGDFNGDGIQDLVTANLNTSTITVLLGNGSGGFQIASGSPFIVGVSPNQIAPLSIAVGDFNNDGIADIAVANSSSNTITIGLGDGTGNFNPAPNSPYALAIAPGSAKDPRSIALADFNGDGKLDIAVANGQTSNIEILLGDGTGQLGVTSANSLISLPANPLFVVAGDFNGDGLADLAVAVNNGITILTGSGSGGFTTPAGGGFSLGVNAISLAVGDFNGDGVLDLVTANTTANNVNLLFGVPTASATSGPLKLTITRNSEIALGSPVLTTFSAAGGTPPYTWSAARLPDGISLDPQTGILSGTPTAAGNTNISIAVFDSTSVATTVSLTLQVLGLNTSTPLPAGATGSAYSVTFSATGGAAPYTFSVPASSTLPPGLNLQSNGVLSGTPLAIGNFNFTVQVADASGFSTSLVYSVIISGATSSLQVIPGALLSGTVGVPYAQSLTAAGGSPPYTWTLIGGTLAPGLTLIGSSGAITGTSPVARTSTFTALATDSAGATSSGVFTLTIAPAPLVVTGLPFLQGIAGAGYPSQLLAGSGGVGPYAFTVSAGTLPPGLTLVQGALSGNPTTAGTYSFSVTMTDSESPAQSVTSAAQITISSQANASLIASTGSVSFSLNAGATAVPPPVQVAVQSTVPFQQLTYSVVANPVVSWLDISSTGTTPGTVTLAIDPGALSLDASPTPLTTSVIISCPQGSYCASYTQTIAVSLSLTSPAPLLTFSQNLVSFTTPISSTSALSQTVPLTNIGGSSASITSITAVDSWLTIPNPPGSVDAGSPANLTFTASPAGLSAGYYVTTVTVQSSAGVITLPVSLEIAAAPLITLSNSGAQFQVTSGSVPANTAGSFQIGVSGGVSGNGSVNWTATVLPGAPWLTLTGATTGSGPATLNYSVAGSRESTPQPYYGTIQLTAPGVANSPLNYQVVLNVAPSNAPPIPILQPAGMVFTSPIGGSPQPQTVVVNSNSGTAVPFSTSVSTRDGNSWLSVMPASGDSSANPGLSTVSVSASPGALPAGIYSGTVNFEYPAAAVRGVNVTMVIEPAAVPPLGCVPARLAPALIDVMSNFAQSAGWATPISIILENDCGALVSNAQVTATFSNGDPPLVLSLVNAATGLYSGTWSPINLAQQMTITITATGTIYSTAVQAATTVSGGVFPVLVPQLTPGGTLQLYNEQVANAIPPGSIVEIYGSNLSPSPLLASTIPLPTMLGVTSVTIGGYPAPLFYVSSGQIDAELPSELTPGNSYQIVVTRSATALQSGGQSTPQTIQIAAAIPGIVTQASGLVIAQHQKDGSFVTEASPAAPGENLTIYATGLGAIINPVADGAAGSASPLSIAQSTPLVTVNGTGGAVSFAGLAPGYVALYQINFQVPPTSPNGDLSLVISQTGFASNAAVLPVHN